MSILERVKTTKQLWELLLPSCPAPDDVQLARWAARFDDAELEYAIGRTAVKARRGLMPDATSAYRYATGVLVRERQMQGSTNAASSR